MVGVKPLLLFFILHIVGGHQPPRIGIVGGGLGGTAVAHFLRKAWPEAELTIFEAAEHLGGRLNTVKVAGEIYECGGTIIHPANQLMAQLVQEMGLKPRKPGPDSRITLVGSQNQVLFTQTSWSFLQPLQFIYRYGLLALLKLHYYIQNLLEHFANIYEFLDEGRYVNSIEDMLKIMSPTPRKKGKSNSDNFSQLAELALEKELLRQGLPQNLIDELVTAAVRTNYGQMPSNVHAFVGSVALAGAEGDLWSIDGGNEKLVEKLGLSSKANVIHSKVGKLIKTSPSGLSQQGEDFEVFDTNDEHLGNFDIVILATPMTRDTQNLTIEGLHFPGAYHRTVATIVEGHVDPAFIGLDDDAQLTHTNFIVDPQNNVNSFALLAPVNYGGDDAVNLPGVWKVFSQLPLSDIELDGIFRDKKQVAVCDWLAYPHYLPNQTDTFTNFRLAEGLYHINAVEWAASAMEMSVIGAKNVANLVVSTHSEKEVHHHQKTKTEL